MTVFVFRLGNKSHYIVPIFYSSNLNLTYEEQAWKELSTRLSRREELVRQQCKLLHTINEYSNSIIKI